MNEVVDTTPTEVAIEYKNKEGQIERYTAVIPFFAIELLKYQIDPELGENSKSAPPNAVRIPLD